MTKECADHLSSVQKTKHVHYKSATHKALGVLDKTLHPKRLVLTVNARAQHLARKGLRALGSSTLDGKDLALGPSWSMPSPNDFKIDTVVV